MQNVTELAQKEQTVQDAREYAESIVETVREPLLVLDADLKVISANRTFYQSFKTKPEETEGQLVYDIGDKQWNIPKLRELLEEILPKNNSFDNYEVEHDFPHIGKRIMRLNARQIYRKTDKTERILVAIEDITESKRVEALGETNQYLENLLDYANAPIIVWDPQFAITRFNHAFESLTGRSANDVIGKTLEILFPPDGVESSMKLIRKTQSGERMETIEIPIQHLSGSIRAVLWNSSTLFATDGKTMIATIAQGQDITKRVRAEERLALSELFLNNVIEQSPVSLWISDSEGTLIKMNKTCREMFGVTDEEAVGKYNFFKDNVIEEQGFMPLVKNVFEKGEIARFTINYDLPRVEHIEVKEGTHKILEVIVSPIKDVHGKFTNALVQHKDITERKKAELALLESEKKFSDTVKYLDEGYYSVTVDGILLEHNLAFNRILGIDITRDMKGVKLPDFWQNPEERTGYLNELMTNGIIKNYEINAKTISNEKKTVRVNSHLIKDEDGKLIRIEGTFIDITELKRAEEMLQNSEIKFRELFNNSQIGMYRTKNDGSAFLDVNKKFAEILGFSQEELLGTAGSIRWANPDEREKMITLIKNQGGLLTNYETQVIAKNGSVIDVLASIELHSDKGYLEGTLMDISERKQTEKSLRESEDKYSKAFMIAPYAMTITNPKDGKFFEVNDAFTSIAGYTREEALADSSVGMNLWVNVKDRNQVVKELFEGRKVAGKEFIFRKKNGEMITGLFSAQIIQLNNEPYILSSIDDITGRKRLEEESKRYLLDLAKSNQDLQQFAYIASHDLQEPLRMIASYLQMIEKRYKNKLDKDADDFINFAVGGAVRMQDMINGLLLFSRVESRGKPFESVDTEAILKDVLVNLEVAISENKAVVTHDYLPSVMVDPSQLILVFQNLIVNAIKFHGEEAPRIHISAEKKEKEWVFSVKDNGLGIDSQYNDKVFVLFQRLGGDKYPGIGLGLTVCKRIIERHGGHIWFDSKLGKGVTFYFTVPIKNEVKKNGNF
jgi:PAS domain S-box-containing protein